MPKTKVTSFTHKKSIGFSMKLTPAESAFIEEKKAKTGLTSAEIIRGYIELFRTWFDLPDYMADALREQMAEKGFDERKYFRELLAREYERTARGAGKRRQSAKGQDR